MSGAIAKFPMEMKRRFEESLAATLALNVEKNKFGEYRSPKTGNLFLAFCYGWYQGEGVLRELPAIQQELVEWKVKTEQALGLRWKGSARPPEKET